MRFVVLFSLILAQSSCGPLLAFADGAAEGRRGAEAFWAEEYETAEAAFREGLEATEGESGPVLQNLWEHLGHTLFARGQIEEAASAFVESYALADTPDVRARTAYDAGTALATADQLEAALPHLRRAVLLAPDWPPARHNYEVVKRMLEGDTPPSGTPPEPSAFAQAIKARADSLVAERQYPDALGTMMDGLERDSTVAAYGDFIQRLGEVVQIEQGAPSASPDSSQ